MATLKLKLDTTYKPKGKPEHEITFPLVIKVSHRRVAKAIQLGFKLRLAEWDTDKLRVRKNFNNSGRANVNILRQWEAANTIVDELSKAQLKQMDVYQLVTLIEAAITDKSEHRINSLLPSQNAEQLIEAAAKPKVTYLDVYAEACRETLLRAKRYGVYQQMKYTLGVVERFYGSAAIPMTIINEDFLNELETWWLGIGNKRNTLFTIMKNLRKLFNLAIKDKESEIGRDDYPFGIHGYTVRTEKTRKRAIKEESLQALRELKLVAESPEWHARNYFLFLFNCWGMSFTDMARLRPENFAEGRTYLSYKRIKLVHNPNSPMITIKLTAEAQRILSHYWDKDLEHNRHIFPVLRDYLPGQLDLKAYNRISTYIQNTNKELKALGGKIGLAHPLTTYVSRHTFGTLGKQKGISTEKISELLGHSDLKTTQVYLSSFENSELNKAAETILG